MSVQNRPRGEITGTKVLIAFVAFFGVVAGVNGIMLQAATSTFGGVEVDSAYRVGLAFNQEIAAAAAQQARHWAVEAKVSRNADDRVDVRVRLRDARDAAPAALSLVARLAHPADRRRDRAITMRAAAPGEFRGETDAPAGEWDLLIEAARDGEVLYRSRGRLTLR